MAMSGNPPSETPPSTQDRIIAKLVEKGGQDPTCPVCHTHVFGVSAFVRFDAAYNIHQPASLTKAYPAIVLICQNCGAFLFVSPLVLGFTERELADLTISETEDGDATPA